VIDSLQPYPDYKDSGLPWLGTMPRHWESGRAKTLFTKMSRPVRPEDEVVTCFRDGRVTLRKNRRLRGFTEATAFSGYQGIRRGDLVIHGMDAFAGAIGVSDSDGKGTPVYNVCQPRCDVNANYYAQLVRVMSQAQWILALAKGIRERSTDFRFETFGNQRIPTPPPPEQAAIVRFLDHANGRIDRAIRAKRKVIALLNEQKQAIIHRAVTRGLDPSVPLKPSGIPWLGEIPEHWEVNRCGSLFYEVVDTGYPNALLLSIDRFKGVIPQALTGRRTRASENRTAYKRVRPGQMAYNLMNAFMGALGFSVYDGIVSPAYAVAQPRKEIEPQYFHELLRTTAYTGEFNRLSYGIMYERNRLYFERFKLVPALTPPLSEQKDIVKWIRAHTSELTTAISNLEREIALLREYRTRLTADVVTGKLDVRAAAVPQDSSDESDLSDLSDGSDPSDLSEPSELSDAPEEDTP
jgi:type I restriction enzyme S subunit